MRKTAIALLWVSLTADAAMPMNLDVKMVNAIFKSEGGHKTKWPYGVKSVKVVSIAEARRVTLVSVRNNWARWERAGKPGKFIPFMAARWCPVSVDPVGNRNWARNVTALMGKDAP